MLDQYVQKRYNETMPVEQYFHEAAREAQKALCKRAKCGAVVVLGGEVVGRGYNAPPNDDVENCKCDTAYAAHQRKPKADRTCCVHAEWRAILEALKHVGDITGGALYFTRVDEGGEILFSGEPYCTVCSHLALDTGLQHFCLWHEEGITEYDTQEYNDVSYAFHSAQ